MADPLSITASLLAVITAAVKSIKALHETVSRYKGRDKTLQRLQDELEGTTVILDALKEAIHTEESILALLRGPIDRCSKVCYEFKQSMVTFNKRSKIGFRDWTKLEFMKGDINEFIDTLSGYKSTISIGLGTINIRTAKVSQKVLEDYHELVQDTAYNLEMHLQRVDEKLSGHTGENLAVLASNFDLGDERETTKLCLRICESAKNHLESLSKQNSPLLQSEQNTEKDEQTYFEAQVLTNQALAANRDNFADVIRQLRNRLESLVLKNDPSDEKERSRLVDDIKTSKECLEVCKLAGEVSSQKIYRIGEVIANGKSDQMVVNSLADLFDIRKASSTDGATQLVGSMPEAALRYVTEKRYNSLFPISSRQFNSTQATETRAAEVVVEKNENSSRDQSNRTYQPSKSRPSHRMPLSNETRRRMESDEGSDTNGET